MDAGFDVITEGTPSRVARVLIPALGIRGTVPPAAAAAVAAALAPGYHLVPPGYDPDAALPGGWSFSRGHRGIPPEYAGLIPWHACAFEHDAGAAALTVAASYEALTRGGGAVRVFRVTLHYGRRLLELREGRER